MISRIPHPPQPLSVRGLALALLLLVLPRLASAQALVNPDDYFHGGAMNYLSNNIPAALEVVTNGLAQFPNDLKLKKLEDLLKQKQDEQKQKQDQQNQDKEDQDKKEQEKKDQDKKDQQKKDDQKKQDQDKKDQQQSKPDKQKSGDKKEQKGQEKPGQMSPAQAARLMDGQKGDEEALIFRPPDKPKDDSKPVKDW